MARSPNETDAPKQSRIRIGLAILLAFAAFWLLPATLGIVYTKSSPIVCYKTGFYSALDPKCLKEVAIVTSVKDIGNAHFQKAVAEELAKALVAANPTKQYWKFPAPCKVTIYKSIEDAVSAKPSLYLIVRAPKWSYLPIPLYSQWTAIVLIDAAITPDRARDLKYPDPFTQNFLPESLRSSRPISLRIVETKTIYGKYPDGKPNVYTVSDEIFVSVEEHGYSFGIFNRNFLTSTVAERAADQVATVLWSGAYERKPLY